MKVFVRKDKRKLIIVLVVLVLLIVGGIWFLKNLPDFAVEVLINSGITTNQNAKYFEDDALYVITTGTGAPLPDAKRVGPQAVVVAGNQVLVFDAGPGSTRQIELIMDASSVDALFLTHYHSDHIGDLGELMLKRWATGGLAEPLPIYGPPGIEEVVAGFESAYQLDVGYRVEHHGQEAMPPSGSGGEVHLFDLGTDLMASDMVYEQDGVQVIAFNVNHSPVFPAVGYRVTYKEKSIVISGDTVFTESLIHHAMGADVLVCEALNHKMSTMVSEATRDIENNASIVAEDIKDYHITPEQAGIVAKKAGIPVLVITHVLPPVPVGILVNPFLKDAREVYDGKLYLAKDGTMVKLSVDSDKITKSELFK
jgi:ribonuclease Z